MTKEHQCGLYCAGHVHAVLVTARAGVTLDMLEGWAAHFGYVLQEARRVLEVDLVTEQVKHKWHWDAGTGEVRPYLPTDARPTDEVWMVWVSLGSSVDEAPREGQVSGRGRWKHLLRWKRSVER